MYRFDNAKSLYSWVDMTLKEWVENHANEYEEFEHIERDIDGLLSDVVNERHVSEAFSSLVRTTRHSVYIKGILDGIGASSVADISTFVRNAYKAIMHDRFEKDTKKYRKLWNRHRNV
ncbi:MAG: hypothetical protein [Bacteriophage sp.]|nr:MAG: hypothetical protein [Bacteriophage sp.]